MTGDRSGQSAAADPPRPRLLQQVRDAVRRKHFSLRTEETYVHWIKRFIFSTVGATPPRWEGRKSPRFSAIW